MRLLFDVAQFFITTNENLKGPCGSLTRIVCVCVCVCACAARDTRREHMLVGGTNKTSLVKGVIHVPVATLDAIDGVRTATGTEFLRFWAEARMCLL